MFVPLETVATGCQPLNRGEGALITKIDITTIRIMLKLNIE